MLVFMHVSGVLVAVSLCYCISKIMFVWICVFVF